MKGRESMERNICVFQDFLTQAHREQIDAAARAAKMHVRYFTTGQFEEAKEYLQHCEVLYAQSPQLLRAAPPTLRWYCTSSAGVDLYCRNDGIFANPDCLLSNSNTYGVTIAEHVVMVALMLLRRMPDYLDSIQNHIWAPPLPVRSIRGCEVTIVPWTVTVEEVMAMHPDGLFISNGPGNPEDAKPVIDLVRALRGKLPIFGICLGHQIIALAYGASTYKLKFGHRGGNHPVKNLQTGKVEITSQNHSYAVKADSLAGTGLTVTHVNLLDGTVEGQKCAADRVFSVQYHPESAPGPQDSAYLFDEFIAMMEGK